MYVIVAYWQAFYVDNNMYIHISLSVASPIIEPSLHVINEMWREKCGNGEKTRSLRKQNRIKHAGEKWCATVTIERKTGLTRPLLL